MSLIEWKISTIENISRRRQVNVIRNGMHPEYNERIARTALRAQVRSPIFPRNRIIDRSIHSSTFLLRRK